MKNKTLKIISLVIILFICLINLTGCFNQKKSEKNNEDNNEVYEKKVTSAYSVTERISDKVLNDWFRFMPDDYWEKNKDKEIIPTDTVSTVSDAAIDANIRLNGRDDGIKAYSHVVNLLLDYYFSNKDGISNN